MLKLLNWLLGHLIVNIVMFPLHVYVWLRLMQAGGCGAHGPKGYQCTVYAGHSGDHASLGEKEDGELIIYDQWPNLGEDNTGDV